MNIYPSYYTTIIISKYFWILKKNIDNIKNLRKKINVKIKIRNDRKIKN